MGFELGKPGRIARRGGHVCWAAGHVRSLRDTEAALDALAWPLSGKRLEAASSITSVEASSTPSRLSPDPWLRQPLALMSRKGNR